MPNYAQAQEGLDVTTIGTYGMSLSNHSAKVACNLTYKRGFCHILTSYPVTKGSNLIAIELEFSTHT
jgi:hypothetical protein